MLFESPMLMWPYVVPFLIPLLMPGWRSLAVIAFFAIALFIWLVFAKLGGPDWLGILVFGLAGVGLVAGIGPGFDGNGVEFGRVLAGY